MTNREQLIKYIDAMNFTTFIGEVRGTTWKYNFVHENDKYFCDIECSEKTGPHETTIIRTDRVDIDDMSEDLLASFVEKTKAYIEKECTEIIKTVSNQETGCAPNVLTNEILEMIGFEKDSNEPSVLILQYMNKEFFVQLTEQKIGCNIVEQTLNGLNTSNIFYFRSDHPLYVHELLMTMKLCGIKVEDSRPEKYDTSNPIEIVKMK